MLPFGLSSRPEMSICVATSFRGTFFMIFATPVDDLLVELLIGALVPILGRVVGLHVLEQRLHVAANLLAFFTASSE